MALIKEFTNYYLRIRSYLRRMALCEEDFQDIIVNFEEMDLKIPKNINKIDLAEWLYYQADLFLLNYYYRYQKITNKSRKDIKIKLKVQYLYNKLVNNYPDFQNNMEIELYEIQNEISFFEMKNIFQIIFKSGYPHQILVFCYQKLIENWTAERIISDLSAQTLENIYSQFINEYAQQSGLPIFWVALCFVELKEKLYQKLGELIKTNDPVFATNLEIYLDYVTEQTILEIYYGKNRTHDINNWCYRVKNKILQNLIEDLKFKFNDRVRTS